MKGVVNAEGFFFPTSVMPINQCRKRILSLWEMGCRIYRFEAGYVLFLSKRRRVQCVSSPGTPVIHTMGTFATIELTEDQATANKADKATVFLVTEGVLHPFPLSDDHQEDPALWIDTSDFFMVQETHTLGKLPPPPELTVKPVKKDAKDILGDKIPEASPKKDNLLKYIEKIKAKKSASASKTVGERTYRKNSVFSFAASFLKLFFVLSSGNNTGTTSGQTGQYPQPTPPKPQRPGLIMTLFSGLIKGSGLWRFFAGKQANYINKMMKMFEKGDYENALKHGISLKGVADLEKIISSWRLPTPRQNLDIHKGIKTHSTTIITDNSTHHYLKSLYEKAFKNLDREGKIEKAAFVLAELLHDSERAVSYLEKHKKHREAAELAESRELPSGLVVRQWFLCGEIDRAVSIAKKTNSFSDAVLHLERTHNHESGMLRLLWAKFLEQSGNYERAVNAIWPVEEARHLAEQWIQITIECGGAAAARMLAKSLSLFSEPKNADKNRVTIARIKTLLGESSDLQATERAVFAKELIKQSKNNQTRALARQTLRTIINDRACSRNWWNRQDFKALLDFSEDAPIKNEFQKMSPSQLFPPMPTSLASRTKPLVYEFSDSGTFEIYDVCMINHNRFLSAHGESGVRLINNQGKVLAHFNVPAHSLVLSDNGNRAIALAKRGEVFRLSQININERKAAFWVETALDLYAHTFDGANWFVVTGSILSAIDVHSEHFKANWNVADLPGYARSLSRSPQHLSILLDSVDDSESWTYDTTGSIRLRERHYIGPQDDYCIATAVSPSGQVAIFVWDEDQQSMIYALKNKGKTVLEIPLDSVAGTIGIPDFSEHWLILPSGNSESVSFNFIHPGYGKNKLVLTFNKTNKIQIKCQTDTALISDSNGRIIAVDLNSGTLIHDIRL